MKSGGEAFPGYLIQLLINIGNNPYIPIPCAYRRSLAILEKIKSTNAHLRFQWIIERDSNLIHHIGISLVIRKFTLHGDRIAPLH